MKVNQNKLILYILFNSQVSKDSMGGGDKIVISIAKKLKDAGREVVFAGCPDGKGMLEKSKAKFDYILLNFFNTASFGFLFSYILRICFSYEILLSGFNSRSVIWSSSDFLPDTLPAFLFRLFHRDSKWFMSFFLRARNPFEGDVEMNLKTFLYFISQTLSIYLFRLTGTKIFVLCEADKDYLTQQKVANNKILILKGGVNMDEFAEVEDKVEKKYDCCFIGRFHYQKGLPTLLNVSHKLLTIKPNLKVAIIGWGNGREVTAIKAQIHGLDLENAIELLGFVDGRRKVEVLKSSKLFLFPSTYESFGVVVAEALAAGVPVVAFDLPVLKEHFKQGISFAKSFDDDDFFKTVSKLLVDENKRSSLVLSAREIVNSLDWSYSTAIVEKTIHFYETDI